MVNVPWNQILGSTTEAEKYRSDVLYQEPVTENLYHLISIFNFWSIGEDSNLLYEEPATVNLYRLISIFNFWLTGEDCYGSSVLTPIHDRTLRWIA